MRNSIIAVGLLILLVSFPGCDTENSIDPVYNDYFVRYIGDSGAQEGVDMLVSPADQTVYLLGTSTSEDLSERVFLAKVTWNGDVVWKRFLSGPSDRAKDIEFSNDGGLVILTETRDNPTLPDDTSPNIKILRTGLDGVKSDSTVIYLQDGSGYTDELPSTITPISDGYLVTGSTNYLKPRTDGEAGVLDLLRVKLLTDLTISNDLPITETNASRNYGIRTVEIAPLKYVSMGSSYKRTNGGANDNFNFWVVAAERPSGETLPPDFGLGIEQAGVDEVLTATCPAFNGGYYLVGKHTEGATMDMYAARVYADESGELTQVSFQGIVKVPGHEEKLLEPVSVCQASVRGDGYLILSNEGTVGLRNIWLTKVSGTDLGQVLWSSSFGLSEANDDRGGAVAELPDGRILVLGTINLGSDNLKMAFIKLNSGGRLAR